MKSTDCQRSGASSYRRFRRLETVFRDATDPILIEDLEGIVLDLNDQAIRTYGYSREELIGRPIKTIVPTDRHTQADELLERCRTGKLVRDVEGIRVTKDGQQTPVLLSLSLLKNEAGQPAAIATFAKNISEIKEAEVEIRQLTRVFRDAADPIILEDLDGVVVDMNSSAEQLYGWSRSELCGKAIKAIVPESRHWQADELLKRCKAGEQVRNVEGLRITREGVELPVLITLSLLNDEEGRPHRIASYAKEITAQKKAEAELRELAAQLEDRVEERTNELATANQRLKHELAVARELSDAADREHEAILLGHSIAVRSLRESIEALGNLNDPLLLTGPAGAGHEAVARALHHASPRAGRPFIFVDVLSAGTADESLFGTRLDDSGETLPGKASLADGGTLYLHGVDRLSAKAQASLMAFLRNFAEARNAGARPIPDIRLISFAYGELSEQSRQGKFDPDLELALGRRRLAVPSLAERQDDILPIAERITLIRARSLGKVMDGLTDKAAKRLQKYSWPGNVEELQSVIERAVVLANGTRLDISEELLREGPKIGSYTLVKRLGAGAMGEVWLARHALLARPAAVKLIRSQAMNVENAQQQALRARFQREARATARLRSPNTVQLYDFGVSDTGNFYYVMEFLDGIDLQRLVDHFGLLCPDRTIHLLRQACLSLSEAHDAGLVHRDIKPSNLFTCQLGTQRDFLKVLDFGVVRLTREKDHLQTKTGLLSGTPACMAPELLHGADAEPVADIYGLGCVAYWLLTGYPVFSAPNAISLMMQHATKNPDPPSLHNPAVSEELDDIVLRCLEKTPEKRFSSALELRAQLRQVPLAGTWDANAAEIWWNQHLANPRKTEKDSHSAA